MGVLQGIAEHSDVIVSSPDLGELFFDDGTSGVIRRGGEGLLIGGFRGVFASFALFEDCRIVAKGERGPGVYPAEV